MKDDEALTVLAEKIEKLEDKLKEQDEILNILKKHIYLSDESISIILDELRCYDDYKKVKEWLDNEKIKRA